MLVYDYIQCALKKDSDTIAIYEKQCKRVTFDNNFTDILRKYHGKRAVTNLFEAERSYIVVSEDEKSVQIVCTNGKAYVYTIPNVRIEV